MLCSVCLSLCACVCGRKGCALQRLELNVCPALYSYTEATVAVKGTWLDSFLFFFIFQQDFFFFLSFFFLGCVCVLCDILVISFFFTPKLIHPTIKLPFVWGRFLLLAKRSCCCCWRWWRSPRDAFKYNIELRVVWETHTFCVSSITSMQR